MASFRVVGKKYTRRELLPRDVIAVLAAHDREATEKAFSVEGSIAWALAWAEITLKEANMPLDPMAAIYLDQNWWYKNARSSRAWYGREIILHAHSFSAAWHGGHTKAALTVLWELATLAAEGRMVEYYVCNASEGASEAKRSDARQARTAVRERWRARATELWAERPARSQTAVATKIDPDPRKRRNIIRTIQDLDPRKKNSWTGAMHLSSQ
jgi:hypothetical protein